jgi:putative flippase GtrA
MRKLLHVCRLLIIRSVDAFYFPCLKFVPIEIFRYGVTGGFNTFFDIMLYYVFYQYVLSRQIVELGIVAISPHIAAFLIVFPITFFTGFMLAKYITFTASELKGKIQLFRYWITVVAAIFLNYLFLKFFVEYLGMEAVAAKVFTTLFIVCFSYVSQRHFSFKTANAGKTVAVTEQENIH